MGVDVARDVEPDHLAPEVPRAEDEVGRHDPRLEDLLAVVDVGEEEVEGAEPLLETALDHLPLVGRHDPGHEVEREDAVGAGIVAVDREPDALREEERVRDPDPLSELGCAHRREALREQAVMRPRLAWTFEHLIEERSEVVAGGQAAVGPGCDIGSDHGAVCVHPAPFTSYAGRCSRDSLTRIARLTRALHLVPARTLTVRVGATRSGGVHPDGAPRGEGLRPSLQPLPRAS